MNWLLLVRKFPKFALVVGVFLASTGLFGFWWFFLRSRSHTNSGKADTTAQVEKIRSRADWLFLADGDLYDAGSGELIFKKWLKGDSPTSLFYDAKESKIIGRYETGFQRYALDGTKDVGLFHKGGLVLASDKKTAVYVKDKDIWQTDVDWAAFKLTKEHQITKIGTFYELYFSQNVLLASESILIVRNKNQLLRVNLKSGEVKPITVQLKDLQSGRSPDGKTLVGFDRSSVFAYDVATDTAKAFEVGRNGASGFTWMDNDRCAFIIGGTAAAIYDRRKGEMAENATLPIKCYRMGESSPDGRYVFCSGQQGGVLVDLEKKTATSISGGAGVTWVSKDTFAFSREIQDSDLRGTWFQKVGESEKRVSLEPFLVSRVGGFIMPLPSGKMIVFATKAGLFKMKPDGTGTAEVIKTAGLSFNVLVIREWTER